MLLPHAHALFCCPMQNIDKETNTKPYLFQFVWSG